MTAPTRAAAIAFLLAAHTPLAGCSTALPPPPQKPAAAVPETRATSLSDTVEPEAVLRAMTIVADWQLKNPSAHKPNEWQEAPFWAGLYELALLSKGRQTYLDAIRRNGESVQWKPGPQPFLADDHAVTQSYFLLYGLEHDRRMIEPALARFGEMLEAPFSESLEFSNDKTTREWVWCDALFMSPPALALAASTTGDGRYADLMDRLWWKTTDYLYDKQERLFYRDSRFFDQREPNGRKVFWSRGNGWVLAGLTRVLEYLPPDYAGRQRFVALFQEMAQRIAELQGDDGYWRASLLDPASRPIPETSGTGFFTYALAWGVNEGLLGRQYERPIRRGWSAMVRAVQSGGKLGYVQRVGDQPGDTGPDQTEIYGTGAFLLAGSEVYRLAAAAVSSPAAMAMAAAKFLESLTPGQRQQAMFAFDGAERTHWNFIPTELFPRNGLTVRQMSESQRKLAHDLLKAGLSQRGHLTATQIMDLESVLAALEATQSAAGAQPQGNRFVRDPERYFFSIFGTPSTLSTWAWRVEGHHMSLHFTVVNGTLVAGSPSFFGTNPAEVREGPKKGTRILGAEEDAARSLIESLDASQREQAIINTTAPNEIVTVAKVKVDPLSPAGIPASALTASQRALLAKLVDVYTGHMAADIAADRLGRIEKAGWDADLLREHVKGTPHND